MTLSTGNPAADAWLGAMSVVTVTALFVLALVCWDAAVWLIKDRRRDGK